MKNTAQMFSTFLRHLSLVFLLMLAGASQVWSQNQPDLGDKKIPSRERKADASKTPANKNTASQSEQSIQKNESLRVQNEAEKTQITEGNQLRKEGNSAGNSTMPKGVLPEKGITLEVVEDVVEYQDLSSDESEIQNPVDSRNPKITRPLSAQTKTPAIAGQPTPTPQTPATTNGCNWQQMTNEAPDPFDAQGAHCRKIYNQAIEAAKLRDPFQKTDFTSPAAPQPPAQILFPPTTQFAPYTVKRSNAGFNPQWIDWILGYSSAEGVDPLLVLEVMRWESSFKPWVVSPAGAGGLMQFMPATAARFGIDRFDEQQSIMGGARYLGFLLRRYRGNVLSALAGYNAGEGAVDAFLQCRSIRAGKKIINPSGRCTTHGIPPYAETQKYSAGIWANYQLSVKKAEGVSDPRQRIAANVRVKFADWQPQLQASR